MALSAISAAVQSEIGCSARTIRFSGSEQPSDSDWKIACLAKAVVAMPTEGVRGGQGGSGGVRGGQGKRARLLGEGGGGDADGGHAEGLRGGGGGGSRGGSSWGGLHTHLLGEGGGGDADGGHAEGLEGVHIMHDARRARASVG